MKIGDLVTFYSKFWDGRTYSNPGLVLEEDDSHRQVRYTILWADGNITTEHPGLLRRVNGASYESRRQS